MLPSASPLYLSLAPQKLEKILNNFFGEIVVKKPLTKKEMKKHYEDYRVRSLKNKKKKKPNCNLRRVF